MNDHWIYAHDWKILGEDRIQRWPSKIGEKRPIKVEISSWIGISVGAKHIKVNVEEEENQWWCEDENAWVTLSCDAERGGYSLKAEVYTEEEAIKTAKYFILLIAGKGRKNHTVYWHGHGKPRFALRR